MAAIDRPGVFRGIITEHTLGVTKKGFPQVVARFQATEFYADTPEMKQAFQLTEDGWVSWEQYDQDMVGYFVLFNDADRFDTDSQLISYEQLQLALGWDGLSFDSFNAGQYVNSKVLFRVASNEYQGNTRLQVNWIDAFDASPTRELKQLDASKLSDLNAKLKVAGAGTPAVAKPAAPAPAPAATPAAAPAPAAQTPQPVAQPAPVPAATPAATPEPAQTAAPAPSAAPPVADPAPPVAEAPAAPAAPEPAPAVVEKPAESSKDDAWAFLHAHKLPDTTDQAIADAFIAACGHIGTDRAEADYTPLDWAAIRDMAAKDLNLNV